MPEDRVTLGDVYRARAAIRGVAKHTPLVHSPALSQRTGATVSLKLELFQDTGAFKLRGAANRLLAMSEAERRRGVVTMSTGNHGRAVAHAANLLNVHAIVCMSRLVPANKVEAIRGLGAEARIVGESQDEAAIEARRLVEEDGMILVPPFDDPHVIAGQGTVGLELLEDMPELDTVLVPLSGGGLIAGIALALKSADPSIRVVGISMDRGAAMVESLRAGRPVEVTEYPSLADSLGGGIGLDNRYSFPLVRDLVDETVLVGEEEIADAMAFTYWNDRLVAEGASVVGAAALLGGHVEVRGERVVSVVSGRNVDMGAFTDIVAGHRDRYTTRNCEESN